MRSPLLLLAGAAVLAAGACHAPRTPREATFIVDLGQRVPGEVRVELRLPSPVSTPVVLSSFASRQTLRISPLDARQGGKPLAVEAGQDQRGFGRWKIQAVPAGGAVTVEYAVHPGVAEEKANSGPTGRRLGYLDSRFGVFSGREIFLLAENPEAADLFRIRFLAPADREVVAPWALTGGTDGHRVRASGTNARLLDGVVALGNFEKAASPDGRFQVFASTQLPPGERGDALRRALDLRADLASRLGCRDAYRLVLVPKSPDGMLISVAPGPGGEGTSLGEGIPTRWLEIGRRIGQACLGLEGEAGRPEGGDEWFLQGLPGYLAMLHSDSAGWRSRQSWLERFFYRAADARIDLRAPGSVGADPALREERAVLVLDRLSREMKREGLPALEESCARILAEKDGVRRFLEGLPGDLRARLNGWLSPDSRPFPFPSREPGDPVLELLPPPGIPVPAPKAARLDLYLGGRNLGLLEQCGCRSKQVGGFARRTSLLRGRLKGAVPSLALELGDVVPFDAESPLLDRQKESESDLSFSLLAGSGTRASVVGFSELSYGPRFLAVRSAKLPRGFLLLSANVAAQEWTLPGSAVLARLPVPVRVFGAEDRDAYRLGRPLEFEDATAGLRWIPPSDSLPSKAGGKESGEIRVVAGPLGPTQVLEIQKRHPEIALILSDDFLAFRRDPRISFPAAGKGEAALAGMLGNTLVAVLNGDSHALLRLGLVLKRGGGITGAEMEELPLDESVPDDPGVRARLDRHYQELARESGLSQPSPMGRRLAQKLDADYIGEEACAACHSDEARSWRSTPHAAAFASILERRRQGVPTCAACHVTGYGEPTGYRGMEDVRLRHVQCESCHGPGSRHLALPVRGTIVGVPEMKDCLECHDPKHSEMTAENFPEYWERIVHAVPVASR